MPLDATESYTQDQGNFIECDCKWVYHCSRKRLRCHDSPFWSAHESCCGLRAHHSHHFCFAFAAAVDSRVWRRLDSHRTTSRTSASARTTLCRCSPSSRAPHSPAGCALWPDLYSIPCSTPEHRATAWRSHSPKQNAEEYQWRMLQMTSAVY